MVLKLEIEELEQRIAPGALVDVSDVNVDKNHVNLHVNANGDHINANNLV